MIDQLHISNFRLFEDFEIEGLKQINLFTGKNNTGKTALLEALRLLAAPKEGSVYVNLLASRGQQNWLKSSSWNTFFNRKILSGAANVSFTINNLEFKRTALHGHPSSDFQVYVEGNEIQNLINNTLNLPVTVTPDDVAIYVPFGGESKFPLQQLWDKIVLTEYEDDVMLVLRETILPDLVRLDVKEERTLVRLKNEPDPVPLKDLGDGAQRLLQLAIALVNARNNFLLIDEIESGLHYSLIENLWDKIFQYAQKWNIQVFATTHSHDVLKAYIYTLEKPQNAGKGTYFRLQQARKTGKIEAVEYSPEELEISLQSNLEPR